MFFGLKLKDFFKFGLGELLIGFRGFRFVRLKEGMFNIYFFVCWFDEKVIIMIFIFMSNMVLVFEDQGQVGDVSVWVVFVEVC